MPSLRRYLDPVPSVRMRAVLAEYFSDPVDFVKILKRSGSIIGGSVIVSILQPGDWVAGDLDMAVEQLGFDVMDRFLLQDGFSVDKARAARLDLDYTHGPGVTFTYFHYAKEMNGRSKTIDLCRVDKISVANFILCVVLVPHFLNEKAPNEALRILPSNRRSYHSTTPMNFYDGEQIICLFPHLFFKQQLAKNILPVTDRLTMGIQKYLDRGYTAVTSGRTVQDMLSMPYDENEARDLGIALQARMENLKKPTWRVAINL